VSRFLEHMAAQKALGHYLKAIDKAGAAKLLVLDDLGVQRPTEWAMERLMTIINHRYENGLPLMATKNKSVESLPGDDEGRIGSRLKRFVPGKVVVMEGPEYITRRKMKGGYAR